MLPPVEALCRWNSRSKLQSQNRGFPTSELAGTRSRPRLPVIDLSCNAVFVTAAPPPRALSSSRKQGQQIWFAASVRIAARGVAPVKLVSASVDGALLAACHCAALDLWEAESSSERRWRLEESEVGGDGNCTPDW